jgi:hypothetical protein
MKQTILQAGHRREALFSLKSFWASLSHSLGVILQFWVLKIAILQFEKSKIAILLFYML